jgi:hypothetical protein
MRSVYVSHRKADPVFLEILVQNLPPLPSHDLLVGVSHFKPKTRSPPRSRSPVPVWSNNDTVPVFRFFLGVPDMAPYRGFGGVKTMVPPGGLPRVHLTPDRQKTPDRPRWTHLWKFRYFMVQPLIILHYVRCRWGALRSGRCHLAGCHIHVDTLVSRWSQSEAGRDSGCFDNQWTCVHVSE